MTRDKRRYGKFSFAKAAELSARINVALPGCYANPAPVGEGPDYWAVGLPSGIFKSRAHMHACHRLVRRVTFHVRGHTRQP